MRWFKRSAKEQESWQAPDGFKLVMDYMRGGYATGFDRDKTYTFLRVGDTETQVFRLSDANPFFNIAGLYYKEFPACLQA